MEIIKKGDIKRLEPKIVFECKRCGCVFKANRKEYNSGWSCENQKYAFCICPTCNATCFKIEE